MKISAEQRREAIGAASRSSVSLATGITVLRANGVKLAKKEADEMLARAVARERVELTLDVIAYEQGAPDTDGKPIPNRNHVRFRDGALMRLGRTGKGAPFLRDHRQGDSEARSGTVLESHTEKVADGHYRILQTVSITEPSAVERALRGLMSGVSVGWHPTGPVLCTLCDAEILTECFHFPGDRDDEAGVVAEWEFTEAELIETSEVPVPAVPSAGIEQIRAALSAATNRAALAQESIDMSKLAGIAAALNLAATAGEDEIHRAVGDLVTERDALKAQLSTEQTRTAEINARLAQHEAQLAKQSEDAWIDAGVRAGKITLGAHETALRAYFKTNPDGARAMLDAAPVITPVGKPSQSATAPANEAPRGDAATRAVLAAQGVDPDKARAFARAFGAADPDKALSLYAAQRSQEG